MARFGKVEGGDLIRVRCEQLTFSSPAGDLGPRSEPQFAEDTRDVIASRALGDPELSGDLAVGQAPGDEDRYLLLAAGEGNGRLVRRGFLRHGDRGRIRLLR
jgi:hypothetical protein